MKHILSYLLLTLVCASCHQTSWTADQIYSKNKEFCSSKLSYSQNSHYGINLEIIQTPLALKGYLSVHSSAIPLYNKETKSVLVTYKIDNDSFQTEGYRLQGGQKIKLDEKLIISWLDALKKGKKIALSLEGYHTIITSEGLNQSLKKLQKLSASNFVYKSKFGLYESLKIQ